MAGGLGVCGHLASSILIISLELLVTMPTSVAGIFHNIVSLQCGIPNGRGCEAPRAFSRSPGVSCKSLGFVENLCSPRFRKQKVNLSNAKRGSRCRNTLTTDVYQQDEHDIAKSKKEEHESGIDLKQWMEEQGLPKCNVALVEHQLAEGDKGKPIHYVVASQDLQVTDILTQCFAPCRSPVCAP